MAANPQQIPIIYKGTALPASPTAANDGIYYIRPNSSVGFITYIITNGVVVQQDAVTSAGITALLANYITGNSNQTGLSGDKTHSGVWTYNGTGSTKINLLRPGSASNVNMSFGFDAPEMYVGMPSTGLFAISLAPSMTVTNRVIWIDNTGRITSKNGFAINGQNDTQVSLAGGGYRPVSDFVLTPVLASYVLQTSLNAQLANYATLAGTQTFSGTNTFSQAPVVPAGTINSHTVNLGQLNSILNNYATITYVNNAISNLKFVSRTYETNNKNNNDRYIGANVIGFRTVEGFDVCVYNPADNGFISPFTGGTNLHNAFMGVLGIKIASGDVAIKGAVNSPNDLSSYIGSDQIYFCLAYVFAPGGVSGIIQFMSIGDIYNHKANATGSEIKDVIIIGEIGAPDILLLNQREV